MSSLSALFSAGAGRYDLLVRLNPGYHRHLRLAAQRLRAGDGPHSVLDLGCGTGASTRAVVQAAPGGRVLGIDASPGMIDQARAKSWPPGVEFRVGLAGDAAVSAEAAPFDACLAAYLLRNVEVDQRTQVLRSVHDQLAPGGVLVVQDYSIAGSSSARRVWNLVCWLVVIPLSALVLRDTRLYRYLWRSVHRMEPVDQWCRRLLAAGFVDLEVHHGTGWQRGILHTVRARRPGSPARPGWARS